MAQKTSPFTSRLFSVNKQFINVDKLLGNKNKLKVAEEKRNRFWWQRKQVEEREKKLEERKGGDEGTGEEKKTTGKFNLSSFGFLDTIKNFLFNTLFGFFVVRLVPQLPKLKGVMMSALKFSDFIIGIAGSILNALATFIDSGYKAFDFARGQIKMLGGDKGLAMMDKVTSMSNTMLNTMFIAAMLFSDLVESDARGGAAKQTVDFVKDRVVEQGAKQTAQQGIIRALVSRVVAAPAAVVGSVGLLSSLLGEATFQLRKVSQKVEKDAYRGLADAQKDPNPITRFFKTAFYQTFAIPGLRLYNFISNGVGTLLDIIGAPFRYAIELINYGIMRITGDEGGIKKQRENLGKLDVRIREQIRQIVNTLSFGTLAKDSGSYGSLFGEGAVKSMGYASGGEVTRGGELLSGVRRGTEKVKATRQIKIATAPLQPGSDVGGMSPYGDGKQGVTKLEAFFPNPKNPGSINPYLYLKNTHSIVESAPFFAPILGLATKIILGDKPSENDYNAAGSSLNNFFGKILDTTITPGKKTTLSDEIGSFDISKTLKNSIQDSISSAASSILSNLSEQFKLKRTEGTGQKASPSAQNGSGPSNNPLSGFGGQAQFVIGDSIARGFAGLGATPGTDSDDSKVGRSAIKVLEILKARGDKLKGALIDLSTGIANSVNDWASVESQLSYLKSIGARVRILGVGNQFSKDNRGINEKLAQMASKYGFYFYGGYKGTSDGVHGSDRDYRELKEKREREVAAAATSSPVGQTSSLVPSGGLKGLTDADWSELAYIVSGEAGPGDDIYGVAANVLVRVASPAWPNTIREVGRQAGQYEAVYKGLARYDKKLAETLKKNQGKIAAALIKLNGRDSFKGRSEYGNMGPGDVKFDSRGNFYHYSSQRSKNSPPPTNPDQSWRKWISAAHQGGYIPRDELVLTHSGEYVIDADSVKTFGMEFYDIINQVENVAQRKNAANRLVEILSQYTEDGYPETEEDYTYYMEEKQSVVIPSYPIIFGRPSDDTGMADEDYSQDYLYT